MQIFPPRTLDERAGAVDPEILDLIAAVLTENGASVDPEKAVYVGPVSFC